LFEINVELSIVLYEEGHLSSYRSLCKRIWGDDPAMPLCSGMPEQLVSISEFTLKMLEF